MEVQSYSYFQWCGYFWGSWVAFFKTDEFSVRVTKITLRIHVLWTQSLLSIFNLFKLSELWPYYLKHVNQIILNHNSLKLSFINIWGRRLNFVDCESSLESNSPDVIALCETNLDSSIDSGNFTVRGCLPLIRKDSSTHSMVSQFMWKKDFLLHGTYL